MKPSATILCALFFLASAQPIVADDEADPKLPSLRMVFFTPSDVTPPANAAERLRQIAHYTEDFFVEWMTHWEYEPARNEMFQREEDGSIEVLFAQGDKPADQYTDGSFRPQAVQGLVREHGIAGNANIWWFFVYVGDPPARYRNYRGSGNSIQGGWALLNYDSSPGEILLDTDIAGGFNQEFTLKGAIHELGHGLGLPHLGPRLNRDTGNSLMGPVTRIWEQHMGPDDRRGYLTEASAAMLWKHPLFTGTSEDRRVKPTVSLRDYRASYDRRQTEINVRGRLVSDRIAHSVIIVDDMDEKPGEYWRRAYVDQVEEDGTFHVVIDEPVPCGGALRIMFCFDNGIVTGDGEKHSIQSAIERPYRYVGQAYRFD